MIASLLVAALLFFLQVRSGVALSPSTFLIILAFAWVTLTGGRLLAVAAGVRSGDASTAWTFGLLAACLAIYLLTLVLPLTAGGAFGVVAVAVAIGYAIQRRQLPRADWRSLSGFALCVAFTAAWCAHAAGAWRSVVDEGVLPLWSDYFFHGGLISQFGDVRALGRGSIYLADHASSFYHFASYGGAAALARLLDQPGLPLAGSAWLPLGFLAMLAGGHVLGARLAGPAGGVAAVIALALIPDASNYGLRNGWLSFHWTLIAHAGATYALGAALLSLALLGESRRALAASALLAGATLVFRAHVFVLLAPAWVAAAAVCAAEPANRRRTAWRMAGVLALGAAVASIALTLVAAGDGAWRVRGVSALGEFLWHVHNLHEPTAYGGLYASLEHLPGWLLTAAGIGLAVLAALGAFVLLLPAAAILAGRAGGLRPLDGAVGWLLLAWLLLMLFAPIPWHGDASDLIHRPFVLAYAACAIWSLCLLVRVSPKSVGAALLAVALVGLPVIFAGAGTMARPKFYWGEADAAARVPPGLAQAAAFLRRNAAPGDVFAVAGLSARQLTFDLSTELCAMSGMPAYLSRPYYEMIKDPARKALVEKRLAALHEVERQPDAAAALRLLQSMRVQWYVVAGEQGPRWDAERARAAFTAATVALYRIP